MAKSTVIVDSGVLSRYLYNKPGYISEIDKIGFDNIKISIVTFIELINWIEKFPIDKKAKGLLKNKIYSIKIEHITESVSKKAEIISKLNPNSKPNDLLIYSTCMVTKQKILTLNTKDFILKKK